MRFDLSRFVALRGVLAIAAVTAPANAGVVRPMTITPQAYTHQVQPTQPIEELGYDAVCPKSGVSSIVAKGGVIKLPACDGWSGTVAYPKNNATPGTPSTLTPYSVAHPPAPSSGQGTPATGTVIAWISSIGTGSSASITFCNFPSCPVKYAHISSTTQLNQTHTYELYVYAFGVQQGSEYVGSPVCAKGTTKACKLTFASPLTGQTLPNGILFWFELDDMG